MRASKTLAKLRKNLPVRMCSLGHFIPPYVRHAANCGFEAIWLDLEHRAMNPREVQAMLAFFHLFDIDCLLRPPTIGKTELYRYLEDGATGLMIPHVSNEEKARMLVQSVKFPPIGDRGIDGAGLDSDFLVQGGGDYTDQANRETFLVVQIETPEAVTNVDRIAAVEGIDALFLGPADLGLRLKQRPDFGFDLNEATDRVAAAAAKHGKAWGQPGGSPEKVSSLLQRGARLVSHGGDFMALRDMLEEKSKDLDEIFAPFGA